MIFYRKAHDPNRILDLVRVAGMAERRFIRYSSFAIKFLQGNAELIFYFSQQLLPLSGKRFYLLA
jgi:hypothetical protein